MSGPRYEPDDPREWLSRARSNLRLATVRDAEVYLEELCYNAQQATEKAIKGVFVKCRIGFPYTHNLARLLDLLADSAIHVPDDLRRAEDLTRFAIEARYPSVAREVTEEQYAEALEIAEAAVGWAERIILDA